MRRISFNLNREARGLGLMAAAAAAIALALPGAASAKPNCSNEQGGCSWTGSASQEFPVLPGINQGLIEFSFGEPGDPWYVDGNQRLENPEQHVGKLNVDWHASRNGATPTYKVEGPFPAICLGRPGALITVTSYSSMIDVSASVQIGDSTIVPLTKASVPSQKHGTDGRNLPVKVCLG